MEVIFFLFVNATKIHQFKTKDSEIKNYPLCLGNISGDFSVNNMKKTVLNECVMSVCTIFLLITELLIPVILSILINI